jgi:hypothetical protein
MQSAAEPASGAPPACAQQAQQAHNARFYKTVLAIPEMSANSSASGWCRPPKVEIEQDQRGGVQELSVWPHPDGVQAAEKAGHDCTP